ncbi:uncharacterized protein EDB93DRAFT_1253411 [Suillus bovinus]|uniref:uncharacterized protein n=1 Tax=Suillus bovinus TaxID=48563 RepID=UPI001B87B84C|nr:uncharacterized protein EDB93DRAFT_1253411 [Suillus bovinus]KAG2138455.1 hypothetical protein EDB93DRAFT_1253411 [Suillus bovinus]
MPKAAHFQYHRHFKPHNSLRLPPWAHLHSYSFDTAHVVSCDTDCTTSAVPDVPQHTLSAVQSPVPAFLLVKILKPRGDVSSVERGGYNLLEAISWPSLDYEETRTFVVHLAWEHLKINKSWSSQAIMYVEVGKKRYHILDHYEDNWVVK